MGYATTNGDNLRRGCRPKVLGERRQKRLVLVSLAQVTAFLLAHSADSLAQDAQVLNVSDRQLGERHSDAQRGQDVQEIHQVLLFVTGIQDDRKVERFWEHMDDFEAGSGQPGCHLVEPRLNVGINGECGRSGQGCPPGVWCGRARA